MAGEFGPALRRLIEESGLSLRRFAAQADYSFGYLSRIQNGEAEPNPKLARRLDAVLDTGGLLYRLVVPASEVLVPTGPVDLSVLGVRPAQPVRDEAEQHRRLGMFHQLLESLRLLGHQSGPADVLAHLRLELPKAWAFARGVEGTPVHPAALQLVARYTEYGGWMAQEAGDDGDATGLILVTAELAERAEDRDLLLYTKIRLAEIALYQDDPDAVISYAQAVQRDATISPRVLAMAAQREAQGHALAGALDLFREAMERAEDWTSQSLAGVPGETLGTTSLVNANAMLSGWALHDLGRFRDAAEILDAQVDGMPATAVRNRTRYGLRRAFAYLELGELEHACELLVPLLDDAWNADSATIRKELKNLLTRLRRYSAERVARETMGLIRPVLRPAR